MDETWVVLLEAAADEGGGTIARDQLERLFNAVNPGPWGGALHSPHRYALQVTTVGSGPAEALVDVLSRWSDAARRLDLPVWKLVRTEVFTPEELEREYDGARRDAIPAQPS